MFIGFLKPHKSCRPRGTIPLTLSAESQSRLKRRSTRAGVLARRARITIGVRVPPRNILEGTTVDVDVK
jgi:hypothetical protein